MNNELRNNNSDLLLISMNPAENTCGQKAEMSYQLNDSEMVLTTSSLVNGSNYTLSPMKAHCEMLRGSSSSGEYIEKDQFMREITDEVRLNMSDMNSRYRPTRQPSLNFQKVSLTDDTASNYSFKSLSNDIQDLSFSVDLRTLNRDVPENTNFNYYNRGVSSSDMYNTEFSHDFPNNNFAPNLPSTSSGFSAEDASTNYVLTENQSDELLLNGIELNENEKLILSNEELAMLTQGKPGSCLELILNNGEVLYAVIDSGNDYSPSSPKMLQISKDILPQRQCPVPVEMNTNLVHVNDMQAESQYACNFSKTPISEFNNDTNYHSVISTSLSKTIDSSPISTESFNLCCDFPSNETSNQFTSVIDSYPIISEKQISYEHSCPTTSSHKEIPTQTNSKIVPNPQVQPIPSKLDYFPNAVNSIVVSETGKKYPKKYSFYSNFPSYLNQDQNYDKREKHDIPEETTASNSNQTNTDPKTTIENELARNIAGNTEQELLKRGFHQVDSSEVQRTSPLRENISVLKRNVTSDIPKDSNRTSVINVTNKKQLNNEGNAINSKFLNSRSESALNSICDRAVQSRARATLPSAYLSINRIKSDSGSKKPVYGVFAKKTIPSRTQFGPFEGVLIKQEEEDSIDDDSHTELRLTVETDKGEFFRLDVSNEDVSNWMRFVRPAGSFKEQNLILSQQGSSLYFTTIEVIHPKQELLVWYSVWYSQTRNYYLLPGDPCANVNAKDLHQIDAVQLDADESQSPRNADKYPAQTKQQPEVLQGATVCDGFDAKNDNDVVIESHFSSNDLTEEDSCKNSKVKSKCGIKNKQNKLNKTLWLCSYCDLTFSNSSVMNLHILIHAADNVETNSDLVSKPHHQEDASSQNNSCPQCSQSFVEKQQLILHVAKHGLKVQRWTDKNIERENSDNSEESDDHMEEKIEEKTFECRPCKKKFKNPAALNVHKRFHSDDSVLECPICEKTFLKLTAMREHVHSHAVNGIYTCPHCPKKYDRYKYIRKHIRACHCKVTFSCKLCKKSFKSQYKLKSHMLRHSDEREFLCANCGKQFKRKDKLTEHMKNTHSEEREKKSLEIMNATSKKKRSIVKKSFKKKLPTKVLSLITENVNDYFYKCYICNIGFKRRGMLVNHLNSFHPGVSLDSIPELNVPILKAYCNFYCLYCDKVYKSNSKRKAHIIKSHPGAKIPGNLERGTVLNDPYAKHVGSVISNPFNCEYCPRQYASRAKLLNHHRKNHADLIPADMKSPRGWNAHRRKKKVEVIPNTTTTTTTASQSVPSSTPTVNNVQLQNVEFQMENNTELATVGVSSQDVITLQPATKESSSGDVNQQIVSLTHLLNDELRNSTNQEQYLKILQSTTGISISQTDENGEHTVSLENSSSLLQQILASYSFSSS
ncbi:PR domain zinc finger protein 10-like [Planococcus citri]|uniref:PR domain zinc finger protein 10-like n=1 Tax=Planococcus citri TaxID=170843 RepID=UPI0031F8A763